MMLVVSLETDKGRVHSTRYCKSRLKTDHEDYSNAICKEAKEREKKGSARGSVQGFGGGATTLCVCVCVHLLQDLIFDTI